MAIGLFEAEAEALGVLAGSVVLHKIPVAFTLGFTFQKQGLTLSDWATRIILGLFVLASPLGLVAGSLASENLVDIALVIIQSVAAGTFVYIGAFDLIMHEFFDPDALLTAGSKLGKLLALYGGWAFVTIIITSLPEHEG